MKRLTRLVCLGGVSTLVLAVSATAAFAQNAYRQTNLVADQPGKAMVTDPNLINPWGLAAGPQTPLWVSDQGTGVATIYPGAVGGTPISIAPLVVSIPGATPTGQVFNPTMGFKLHQGTTNDPALFIFDSLSGKITAWNQSLSPITGAITVAHSAGAVYTGLALAQIPHRGSFVYAADFAHARIDVLNSAWGWANLPGQFRDRRLPHGYAPFNIQNIDGKLYVAYAKVGPSGTELIGAGRGFVDVYSARGFLLHRLVKRGALNAPWGLVKAPGDFGRFSHDLLVGNFGDGTINAYNPGNGHWLGVLRRPNGHRVVNEGLWALRFGNGMTGGSHGLLFSAGVGGEAHGLLGVLRVAH
jgi:uncharacterized protein (TIGR03118 family)